ncbi:MAG: histidinol-phosphatase [Treponema sp.]|nr:histidinol-phosphatase [Treponema sp.]
MSGQKLSSMHTHTTFCDGRDDVETMCRNAHTKNLFAIGFSAHAPVEKQICRQTEWHIKDEHVHDYTAEVKAAKERWSGKLNVFLGYEVDYINGKRSALDSDITALNLDFIIGSVHYLFPENGAEPFTVDGSKEEFEKGLKDGFNGDAQKLMHSYYDAMLEMIKKGGFDILGHADLLKKNCQGENYWQENIEICRQKEVAIAAKKADLVIEANTGGLNRGKIKDLYPSLSFLKIINEQNIPVIITADAHKANDIDGNYNIALNTLILADFKEHFIFYGKRNGKAIWKKEKILQI